MEDNKFTDEEIIEIYNKDYIGNHMGGPSLKKKYGFDFYKKFHELGLSIRSNQEKSRKYTCDTNYFEIIDTQEKAYWLGFLMGDGYITSNGNTKRVGLSIKIDDIKHLEKLNKSLNSSIPIHTYKVETSGYKIGTEYCRIIISEDKMAKDLIKHGCVENKSNILQPPNIDIDLQRHWIRGYMDANGSIAITSPSEKHKKETYEIKFVGTEAVLDWIQNVLINDNIIMRKYPLRKRKEEQIVSMFEFGGNHLTQAFLDYIYKDATLWLDRKHDRYLKLIEVNKEENTRKPLYRLFGQMYEERQNVK